MYHKVTSNRLATTLNYMSHGFSSFDEHKFLGWMKVNGEWHWGVELDGEGHVAVHVFKTRPGFFWGDDENDTLGLATAKPYVLMFYGSDNSSYFMRFRTLEDAIKEYQQRDTIDCEAKGIMYYNS